MEKGSNFQKCMVEKVIFNHFLPLFLLFSIFLTFLFVLGLDGPLLQQNNFEHHPYYIFEFCEICISLFSATFPFRKASTFWSNIQSSSIFITFSFGVYVFLWVTIDPGDSDDWFESVGTSQGSALSTLSITMVLYPISFSFLATTPTLDFSIVKKALSGFYYITLLIFSFCCFP